MDVDIDRLGNIQATIVAGRDGRKQQAGLALVVDRKSNPWQPDQRYVMDAQGDITGGTPAFALIKANLFSLEHPAVVAGRAGRVGALSNGGELVGPVQESGSTSSLRAEQ